MPRLQPARRSRNIRGVLRFQDFSINTDVIVLSTPEIAGLPYVISGLVAAGGLAAALSTADGLVRAIANALSHEIYYKMLDPNAPNRAPAHGGPCALVLRGSCVRGTCDNATVGHPDDGGVGVLAGDGW